MAKYHQVKNALIAQCRQNKNFEIQPIDATKFEGLIDGENVAIFTTLDGARAWLLRAKQSLIEGGDIITVIDDF